MAGQMSDNDWKFMLIDLQILVKQNPARRSSTSIEAAKLFDEEESFCYKAEKELQ